MLLISIQILKIRYIRYFERFYRDKNLDLMNKILSMAVVSLVLVAGMTTSVVRLFQTASASADTINSYGHTTENKNNQHSNIGTTSNIGGNHDNTGCVLKSNNDQGSICHDNHH